MPSVFPSHNSDEMKAISVVRLALKFREHEVNYKSTN